MRGGSEYVTIIAHSSRSIEVGWYTQMAGAEAAYADAGGAGLADGADGAEDAEVVGSNMDDGRFQAQVANVTRCCHHCCTEQKSSEFVDHLHHHPDYSRKPTRTAR